MEKAKAPKGQVRETAESYLKKHKKLLEKKRPYLEKFQFVGEFVDQKMVNFLGTTPPGSFLNKNLYDSTACKANKKMAASLIGLMWQNGGKSIELIPPEELKNPKREELDYYKFATARVQKAFDDPKAGFPLALEEYKLGQTGFGTSGIHVEEGSKIGTLLKFKSMGVDVWCFAEGPNGTITKAYGQTKWTIENAAAEWNIENLSEKSRDKLLKGDCDDEINILHVIEPRYNFDPEKQGNLDMPVKSVIIEMDEKHIIKESGYHEMPAAVARFSKRANEDYGTSPAMDALPDTLVINQVHEDYLVANEKRLEPPLGVYSDAILGSNQVDTSAKGITVVNPQGKYMGSGGQPIFPLYEVGDTNAALELIDRLSQSINEHFMVDRLLDFNNQEQMTLGEAQMRMQIRGEGIIPLAMRQTIEMYIPCIERAVAVIFRNGLLGVVPGSEIDLKMEALKKETYPIPERIANLIAEGKDFYEIKFLTPAARLMQAEEARGISQSMQFHASLLQFYPEAKNYVNPKEAFERVANSFGAKGILNDDDTIKKLEEAQAQQAQMAAQAQAQDAQNQLDKGSAEAAIMGAQAQREQEMSA